MATGCALMCSAFASVLLITEGIQVDINGVRDEVLNKGDAMETVPPTPDAECEDLLNGGPDWYDGEFHFDNFEELVTRCYAEERSRIKAGTLQFVHVGKCAGSSVRSILNHCPGHFREFHLHPIDHCKCDIPRKWVVSVRDPLARAISAFNWRSPVNAPHAHGENKFSKHEAQLYECFNTANAFAEALEDGGKCGSYARRALHSPIHSEHLGMGLAYYFKTNLECILKQDVYLVRSEHFLNDAQTVAKLLGATKFPIEPHVFSDYPMKNSTFVSAKGKRLLLKHLKEDYNVLRKLEAAAQNGKQGTH